MSVTMLVTCLSALSQEGNVVVSLGNALHVGSKACLYEFTELNMSVGSQFAPPPPLPPQEY